MNYKDIIIGTLIRKRVEELGIDENDICSFMTCDKDTVAHTYMANTLDIDTVLKWSKLLKYDFFQLYSQHLMLTFPAKPIDNSIAKITYFLPRFRENLYSEDIIDFIMELIEKKEKTKRQVIEEYGVPEAVLNRWINKNKVNNISKV
ncbi:MAG: transposase [Chryseobacterium sp.]|nr:transposase [Chryseobacterium sp.]